LENINAVTDGVMTPLLRNYLEQQLPKGKSDKKSKNKITLGVIDSKIGNHIAESLGVHVESSETILELFRGIRLHFVRFIKGLKASDLSQSQLGLGHSYSRSKVKFNVNRVDNMIIQSISLLDQLDKDLNTFSMRVREWYSWHFPELVKIVNDNEQFARLTIIIGDKATLNEDKLPAITEVVKNDESKAKQVLDAARMSMGTDISDIDLMNIERFARQVVSLTKYRQELHAYLTKKMNDVAPNLSALIGEQVGARLISHAGSLTSLAKYPASTVQILGAEKALFRSLKTKGNTPKYGLIFNSTFIGRAAPKNKGRIARYLANKCSIASRIDSFADVPSDTVGTKLRDQVEERLEFYKSGKAPKKNLDVMREALAASEEKTTSKKDMKKRAAETETITETEQVTKGKKKQKKEKKESVQETPPPPTTANVDTEAAPMETEKEKKKKAKKAKKAAEQATDV